MLEYGPWSERELQISFDLYRQGIFSVLDVELGGSCNMSCIYCDTPERSADALLNLKLVEKLFAHGDTRWLFICGLGEPTATGNHDKFSELMDLCECYGVKCSMFTNLFSMSEVVKRVLKNGTLNILFKMDSFDRRTVSYLYGIGDASQYLSNISEVAEFVNGDGAHTNIAASIVPTSYNKDEIVDIVKFCVSSRIAPMIGGLENAGKSTEVFESIKADDSDLMDVKREVSEILGHGYRVPVCPAVVGGMHIAHDNTLLADFYTGLSCHWFWMEAPKTKVLGSLDETWHAGDMYRLIEEYRDERLAFVRESIDGMVEQPFGGCGGDMGDLLRGYVRMQEEKRITLVSPR